MNPQDEYEDEYDLKKTLTDLENLYREKIEKGGIVANKRHGIGEHVERDSLIVLDDVSGIVDRYPYFVTFMTTCRKFGYNQLYIFHETTISSQRWNDILCQTQIFCIFPLLMDLVMNYLVKFVSRSDGKGYISRRQLWLTNPVQSIGKKSGFSGFFV